ncbi:MAG: SHOCT domain-containing protein [Dehalogenimonas sp.]|uniref:SHOCT domain-containing protein n=1 Tax=Candidatus Dehalogenimonas loeffleri TaxID=3127115 RepID=A0ABZ2JBU3_9CHLR|nr:SHOCT domain-containing protein [Dehalogenimonas sp.]
MMILWVVVIGLIIWGVFSLVKNGNLNTGGGGTPARREPMDIAKERYAKGEITKEEFEDIKRNL